MPRMSEKISIWFDYPDDPDKARVEVCNLTDEDLAAIKKESTVVRDFMGEDGRVQREQLLDVAADRRETVKRAVKNLENFFDEGGKPMTATPETLSRWSCNAKFMNFINEKWPLVNAEAEKQTEEKRKNS